MRTSTLLAALAVLVPAAARAALPPLEVGARAGWATAFGDAAKDVGMDELAVGAQVPVQLEAGARLLPALAAGVYASYGVGRVSDAAIFGACGTPGVSCSGRDVRAGVQGRWAFTSVQPFVPWAGAGLGWEWAHAEGKDVGGTDSVDVNGFELSLQGGGDWRVTPRLSVGPWIQLAAGRYQSGKVAVAGTTVGSGAITHKTFHGWLGLGVGGRFDL